MLSYGPCHWSSVSIYWEEKQMLGQVDFIEINWEINWTVWWGKLWLDWLGPYWCHTGSISCQPVTSIVLLFYGNSLSILNTNSGYCNLWLGKDLVDGCEKLVYSLGGHIIKKNIYTCIIVSWFCVKQE